MAFDKATRNRLASFVGKARDLIADEFTQQFQSLYGISDKGRITPVDQLGHLDDMGLAIASLLRERIDYLLKTHPNDRDGINEAVARLAREQAFTVINRLAAIRMAEKRGIIVESVGKGYQSRGFKVFEQVAGAGLGDTYCRYCRYLYCLFDELAVDLGILFDRRSPQGLLFPRETALQALLALLNAPDLDPLWDEDETIGWIYQYYNDPAERKKMRDESAAPRNSRELAVRNQFFTPRYVVEFLTDNTLGRIWYEMTQGKTLLKDQCRYLVRRPTEIFLTSGESAPETASQDGLNQEELLRQPVYISYRSLKDPREIGLLDPACGSMHFGLYAFDLYEIIYEEAWNMGMETLHSDFHDKDTFLREVPRLIIEHNIHGIDIDPRATQIAGLSLWLRAQKSWHSQSVPATQRPRITRSNIVCAEPMPGSTEMIKEFTATLHPPLLGQLVEKVFEQMQLAGEAGSLLKIEEEIATLVKEAKKLWQTRPRAEQMELSLGLEAKPKQGEFPLDVSGISDEHFWETAEERIYAALQAYAEQAESGGYQRRLFADDAARGFAFIDVCRKRYDVVLMNPPFGEASNQLTILADVKFPSWNRNILCAFIDAQSKMLSRKGLLGSVIDRTASVKTTYERFRREVLLDKESLQTQVNLGWGVLDGANVEVAALISSIADVDTPNVFFDVGSEHMEEKEPVLQKATQGVIIGKIDRNTFIADPRLFAKLPNAAIAFDFPGWLLSAFSTSPSLQYAGFSAFVGHSFKSERHFRLLWEIGLLEPVGFNQHNWAWLFNGGEYCPFYNPERDIVLYGKNGSAVANHESVTFRSLPLHGHRGIGYGKRGDFIDVQVLSPEYVFTVEGEGAVVERESDQFYYSALIGSNVFAYGISLYCGQHKYPGYVNVFPSPSVALEVKQQIVSQARYIWQAKYEWQTGDETDSVFVRPRILSDSYDSLRSAIDAVYAKEAELNKRICDGQEAIEQHFEKVYKIGPIDLLVLHRYAERRPIDRVCSDGSQSVREKYMSTASEFLSYLLGCVYGRWNIYISLQSDLEIPMRDLSSPPSRYAPGALKIDNENIAYYKGPDRYPLPISWSGIMVDDENHPEDIVTRVREALEVIWKNRADTIEQESCELLGVKTLRDYFRRPASFFADHLKRYSKSRRQAPIYWPLSTANGSYTLWIYYHRLTDQTLHAALVDYVDPKLKSIHAEISALRESGNHRNRLETLLDLEKELSDFHDEIEGIIKLPWKPNLNDGVLITASPLWKLFRLPKWQKDLKACWEKLEKGEYDWAHLAYSIWPDRVEKACKKDRSIAIAHNLEHLCQEVTPQKKAKRGRKVMPDR